MDPFDALAESFRGLGMDPEAARQAAVGRSGSEAEARREMREAALRREAEAAVAEAVRAVASRNGWTEARALAFVRDKAREWAGLPLSEGVARLRGLSG
ncbi:MAG: hypothetical protein IRZ07_30735 [Microbispora sp.]|nr:hypothetical protein [Microbispora sp.]